MRKLSFVLAVMLLANAAAGAQEQEEDAGIGLSAGIELGLGNVVDKAVFSITPNIVYEQSFGALDVFGELDYTIAFDDPAGHELYLEAELGYNVQVSEPGVLSIIVNNNNTIFLAPALDEGAAHLGVLEPGLKYTHTFGFGDLSGKIGFPFDYLTGIEGETAAGAFVRLGWDSTFGLGLEFTGYTDIHPEADFWGFGLLASYEQGLFYGEMEFKANKEFNTFEILPEIDISLGSWKFIARAELYKFDGLDDWLLMPAIGAKFSF